MTTKPSEDERPDPIRLRGDDDGWWLEDDPLGRVWDTAADAMAEFPADWWAEDGCWYATAFSPSPPASLPGGGRG